METPKCENCRWWRRLPKKPWGSCYFEPEVIEKYPDEFCHHFESQQKPERTTDESNNS